MYFRGAPSLVAVAILVSLACTACGSSSIGPPAGTPVATGLVPPSASAPAISTPATTTAAASCPTAAAVDAVLGTSLPAPVGISTGSTQLPPGATGIACDYHASTYNVIIELISNIAPSSIANFTAHFPVPPMAVTGVGDQAFSFSQTLGPGRVNESVVATMGSTLVSIGATYTPATLAQVEALVNSLL